MILLLVYFPHGMPAEPRSDLHQEMAPREEIYFRIPLVDTAKALPKTAAESVPDTRKPSDPVDPSASSLAQSDEPKMENAASYGRLTIISKPLRPDNFHQTIVQPLSPPDLKITNDVKVPNIVLVLGKQPDMAKPAFPSTHNDTKPVIANRQIASVAAPSVAPTQQSPVLPQSDAPEIAKPGYAVTPADVKPVAIKRPVASVAAPPVASSVQNPVLPLGEAPDIAKPAFPMTANDAKPTVASRPVASLEAPSVGASQQDAVLAGISQGRASGPRLAIPTAAPSTPLAKRSGQTGQAATPLAPTLATSGDKIDLVAIGINPADPSSEIALPPGNRSGQFTITPAGSLTGNTPSRGGDANSGKIPGAGAHEVSGETLSKSGAGTLSIAGPGGSGDANGLLDPALGASLVFPVPAEMLAKARQNHLVISTGPIGGGGLNVYGALECGRIYTVFLEMPKGNWTLQYCEKKAPGVEQGAQSSSNVIHLETALTPPDAQTRFDFERLAVPPEKAHKSIILKGIIREDGNVDQVEVYQGLLPQMDEAARLALSKWRFKPALRDGKPVPLEILVGIPSTATTVP